jgi:hypothetical protein
MNVQTAMQLHMSAMLKPETDEERSLVSLYRMLDDLCQRYKGDPQVEVAVISVATGIIHMIDFGTGRIDPTTLEQKVRDTVQEAGFDAGVI